MNLNLFAMIDAYHKNQDLIRNHFSKKEHYNEVNAVAPSKTILGLAVGTFLILLLINIVIYIWVIIALLKFWNKMNIIAIILSIICFFSGLGIVSLLIIYITKSN